jgi:hypothetical protein
VTVLETTAVKVTLAPALAVVADEVKVVVLAAWVTLSTADDDALAAHCVEPAYLRLKVCAPGASGCDEVLTVKATAAGLLPLRLVVASGAVPSSSVTMPVGAGPRAPTVTVPFTVTGVPRETVAGPLTVMPSTSGPCVTTATTLLVVVGL